MVKTALKNPYAVIVFALAIFVIGVTAISKLPTDILPTFKTPAVQVVTFYPGMPAEVMEKDITSRLERWTGQSNGIARQEAKSMIGVSVVKDFFREDVDPNTAMSQVTSLAMSDLYYLPPGTIPPMVMPFDPTASIPLCLISVSSPTFDETKLYDVAYFDLRNRLQSITGVIAPAVYGGRLRRILAYVDPFKAQARGLSSLDVINSIRDSNVMIPTGNAKFGVLDYQINANGMVPTVPELNALPLACLGAFIGLYFTNETLNAMTLGGIAVVIGMLIDESIVVLENTARHLHEGASQFEAALSGASEVMRPLTIVTITLSVVFFPVVVITGIGQFLFTPMAKAVIFAIVTSRLLASTFVPVCAARFFRASSKSSSEGEDWFARVRGRYLDLLERVLRLRWLVVGAVAALFIMSMFIFKFIGTELFPQSDAGQFTVHVRGMTGLRVEKTEQLISEVEKAVQAAVLERDRKMVISNIGVLLDWPAAYTPNSGPQDAFILVQLAEHHGRSTFSYVDELRKKLPEQFPGTEFSFDTGGMLTAALNGGLPSPINIQVEGNKLEQARDIAEKIKRYAETVRGTVDVRIQQRLY